MYLYDFSAVISVDFLSIVVAPVKHFKITPVLIDCLLLGWRSNSQAAGDRGIDATIYLVGRNLSAGSRIAAELKKSNPRGSFQFIQLDLSLLRNLETVCAAVKSKEQAIVLLFMSTGRIALSTQSMLNFR